MSTRSIIATSDADGVFRGRYVHWDGYPTGVGEAARTIVQRDGLAAAVKTLVVDHTVWSSIDGVGREARDISVEGYGDALDDIADADAWITGTDVDAWDTEYAYVLRPEGIDVHVRLQGGWVLAATVAYDEEGGMRSAELTAQRMRAAHDIRF